MDFDHAQPSPQDQPLFNDAEQLLARTPFLFPNFIIYEIWEGQENIQTLENYEVATAVVTISGLGTPIHEVRRAIEDPNSETECFGEVLPNICNGGLKWVYDGGYELITW